MQAKAGAGSATLSMVRCFFMVQIYKFFFVFRNLIIQNPIVRHMPPLNLLMHVCEGWEAMPMLLNVLLYLLWYVVIFHYHFLHYTGQNRVRQGQSCIVFDVHWTETGTDVNDKNCNFCNFVPPKKVRHISGISLDLSSV